MGTRINLERGIPVTHRDDLLEIDGKEFCDRSTLFVLKHVAELVSKEAARFVTATNEN